MAEVERLKKSMEVMAQSLEASNTVVELAGNTLQKHKDGFKVLMNQKQQELLDTQAAAKKTKEELDRLVAENKSIDDIIFGKYHQLIFLGVNLILADVQTRRF